MTTTTRILLVFAFFGGIINHSMSQKNNLLPSNAYNPELIKEGTDYVRLSSTEKMGYFVLFDEITKDSVLINKDWITDNPEKVRIIKDGEIYINTYSQSILINDERMVDSILIATKKRFPRPFRPQNYLNSEEKKKKNR